MGRANTNLIPLNPWAARYNTWLLIKLTPKTVGFPPLFYALLVTGLVPSMAGHGRIDNSSCRNEECRHYFDVHTLLCGCCLGG
jgi:hypothetical protein